MSNKINNSGLPKGWINIPLREIITLEYGKGLTEKDRKVGKYTVWGSSGIVGYNENYLIEGPVIIIGRKGSVGSIYYSSDNCWPIDTTYYVKPVKSLSFKFVYYLLRHLNLISLDKSTTIPGLNRENVYSQNIKLPPAKEQYRIIEKIEELLSQIDEADQSLKKVQKKIEIYRYAVLKSAFLGKLTKDWRNLNELETSREYLLRIKKYQEELYDNESSIKTNKKPQEAIVISLDHRKKNQALPSQWTLVPLGNISNVIRGASPRPAGDPLYFGGDKIPWITVADITKDDHIYLTNVANYLTEEGKSKSRYIEKNSLLLSNSGATLGVPKITLISGCINDGSVAILDLINKDLQLYLCWFLKSLTDELRKSTQGAGQPNLNTNIVKNILIPFPSYNEQLYIVQEIESRFTIADKLHQTINETLARIEALRQTILKKAFDGQLVEQEITDEPASELLNTILDERNEYFNSREELKKLKPKNEKTMQPIKSILEILNESKIPISAKDVWLKSKHKDDIEAFYAELRELQDKIVEVKTDTESLLTIRNEN